MVPWAGVLAGGATELVCDYFQVSIQDECPSARFDWEAFGERLFVFRAQVFLGDLEGARTGVTSLLGAVSHDRDLQWECPLAVASVLWTLAQMSAAAGEGAESILSLVQRSFRLLKLRGLHACRPWPVQTREVWQAGEGLIARLSSRPSLVDGIAKSLRFMTLSLLSACPADVDRRQRDLALKNHQEYCEMHGYHWEEVEEVDVHAGVDIPLDEWLAPSLPSLGSGWILWLGCDVIITDAARTIDSLMGKYINDVTSDNICALATASPVGVATNVVLLNSQAVDRCNSGGIVLVEPGDLGAPGATVADMPARTHWKQGDFIRHHSCSEACLSEMEEAHAFFVESR
mmetsp:Transcript_89067/g.203732  ORF Transcript_89067/g.203732 Transcript_89067/m.203732 type:complete len:345 (+) Transcript_89067:30-1064(+)